MVARQKKRQGWWAITVVFQIGLGIVTLLMQAPEGLAALHQVTAATLFCAAIWHTYELAATRPSPDPDRR